ncbi:hypothetical protein, partial [Flammeovirga agarivorans]
RSLAITLWAINMKLPIEYRWLKAHSFEGLRPWYFVDPSKSEGLRKEYQLETGKDIIPIARRQDNDEFAGFEIIDNEIQNKVLTVHLTWSSKLERANYPSITESKSIFKWLEQVVIPETIDWINEDELEDILGTEND